LGEAAGSPGYGLRHRVLDVSDRAAFAPYFVETGRRCEGSHRFRLASAAFRSYMRAIDLDGRLCLQSLPAHPGELFSSSIDHCKRLLDTLPRV
jgi:hypothetical protein